VGGAEGIGGWDMRDPLEVACGLRWQHRIEDGCGAAVRLSCPGCGSLIILDDQVGTPECDPRCT
jgi:hypothetical protein